MSAKILAFSGSLRKESFNQRAAAVAAELARERGAETTLISLRDYEMPIFNQDDEEETGVPANARAFREKLLAHDGFILACPEYNGSVTGALKNALDWASRAKQGDEAPLECFAGKAVALVAASPGGLGGRRGLTHVREILADVGCHVVPNMVAISQVHTKFGGDGELTHDDTRASLASLAETLVRTATALRSA
ncbi:MAG: NAD(P)H-dependent oxidoreductase [Planctomycetota bacterium]